MGTYKQVVIVCTVHIYVWGPLTRNRKAQLMELIQIKLKSE